MRMWWFSVQLATVLLVLSSEVTFGDEGHCISYGQCTTGNKAKNCYYNGPAKRVLDDKENGVTMLETLISFCPNLYTGNDTVTCCDYDQLKTLVKSMNFPAPMYSRCPSCWADYRDLFCASTCNPHMSKFLQVQATNESTNVSNICPNPPCQILQIGYLLTEEYANTLYNACDHVQFPSSNRPVIGSFCGSRTAEQCNATYFLNYQGSTANGFAPFEINFTIIDHYPGYEPYNRKLYRCNEALNGTHCGGACSCSDCPASCPAPPWIPTAPRLFKIGSVDGIVVVVVICFCAFLAAFVMYLFFGIYLHRVNVHEPRLKMTSEQVEYNLLEKSDVDANSSVSMNDDCGDKQQHHDKTETCKKLGCIGRIVIAFFQWWGTFCGSHPFTVIVSCVGVVAVLSLGMLKLTVTTDPVKLWSSPYSQSQLEKNYFDSHFGPYYRTEQVIIRAPNSKPFNYTQNIRFTEHILFGGVFKREVMEEVFWLQENITNLKTDGNITLNDICFQPLKPDNDHCAIESVWQYFQNNFTNLNMTLRDRFGVLADYHTHLLYCFNDPTSVNSTTLHHSCLADYGGLVPPDVALGGYDDSSTNPSYAQADTLFLTFILNNNIDESKNKNAEAWEQVFIEYLKNYEGNLINISFSSESSRQEEIILETFDVLPVAISYLVMFLYVAVFLGKIQPLWRILLDSKKFLSLTGVLIVLCSVLSSMGFLGYCLLPMNYLIVKVVPLLVLAVGVDNILKLVQEFQVERQNPGHLNLAEQVGIALGRAAPSMLLTGLAETITFLLGALIPVPVVRSFSLYVGVAVLINLLLQLTCFVALLYLDAEHQLVKSVCTKLSSQDKMASSDEECCREECCYDLVQRCIKDFYSNFLLQDTVRAVVLVVFFGGFAASIVSMTHLHVGMNQNNSLPKGSYLQDYFSDQALYARAGPPVLFVVKGGLNYSDPYEQNKICGLSGCNSDSLTEQLSAQASISKYSKIANTPNSWLDDYLTWISPGINCCRIYEKSGEFCSATEPMDASYCKKCLKANDLLTCFSPKPRPILSPNFITYAAPSHAMYAAVVDFESNNSNSIQSSYFATYHTTLVTDTDYIDALKRSQAISDNITLTLNGTEVFPYSPFYVFYNQYLTIVHEAALTLGLCAGAIFVLVLLTVVFYPFQTAVIITLTSAMIVVDLMGIMYLWNISFNAVSVVNLVMTFGISVQFCTHMTVGPERNVAGARHPLMDEGPSLLVGTTVTKLIGITTLALSTTPIFEIYYFRMYLSMALLGAAHGLIFLPVLLSYLGPTSSGNTQVKHLK